MDCQLLAASDARWDEALERLPHDFYHRAAYHRFESSNGEGTPFAFLASSTDGESMLWPYLVRDVEIPGVQRRIDSTEVRSAYGYPGPVFSSNCTPAFVREALQNLLSHWRQQKVVNAFARLHPGLATHDPLVASGLQELGLINHGSTVSIDLSVSPEERFANYSATLRKGIRRNERGGAVTEHDAAFHHLPEFFRFYVATMDRNRASKYYYFPLEYFERVAAHSPGTVNLFVTRFGGDAACAALMSEHRGQMQALFIMGNPEFEDKAPSRTLIHDVCAWGRARGCHDLHLGGGRGGAEDSLFRFKAQFSNVHRAFYTCRIVVDQEAYADCVRLRASIDPVATDETYFPVWRKPLPVREIAVAS